MKKKLSYDTYCIALNIDEAFRMGRISKGVKCSVSGCGKDAIRSISAEKVRLAKLKIGSNERRAYLCKEHYKEYKKKTKKDKKVEQWRYKGV